MPRSSEDKMSEGKIYMETYHLFNRFLLLILFFLYIAKGWYNRKNITPVSINSTLILFFGSWKSTLISDKLTKG